MQANPSWHSPDAIARARAIKVILFDVDGVLTDGAIWYFPSASGALVEVKAFSAHDGIGIVLARLAGLKTGVITKRHSESLHQRARDLRMDFVHQGIDDKRAQLVEILAAQGWQPHEAACMGDDIVDLTMMRHAGLAAAPANARPEILAEAHFISAQRGGEGAARDLIDFILKAQGVYERVVFDKYLRAPEPDAGPA